MRALVEVDGIDLGTKHDNSRKSFEDWAPPHIRAILSAARVERDVRER